MIQTYWVMYFTRIVHDLTAPLRAKIFACFWHGMQTGNGLHSRILLNSDVKISDRSDLSRTTILRVVSRRKIPPQVYTKEAVVG